MNLANFIAGQEWIIVIIIAVVLIFGAKKIPQLAKTFGKAKGEFEKGKIEADKELKDFKDGIDNVAKNETDNVNKDKEAKAD